MRKSLLAAAAACALSLSASAQPAANKGCGDHICTKTEGHKLVENRKNGELIDCRIEHIARALDAPYAFVFIAIASEGEILPYMRIALRGVRITPGDAPNEKLPLRSAWIVAGDSDFNTVDWDASTHDGTVLLRTDVMPEDRSPVARLAAVATTETYAALIHTADGQELRVGFVQLRPTGDIAKRFLACTEELRRSVGG